MLKKLLYVLSFLFVTHSLFAQTSVTLSGTSYTETFDAIGSGLPTGWTNYTAASASSLGGIAAFSTSATNWTVTTGGFRNSASGDLGLPATTPQQSAAADRALSVRQVGNTSTTFPNSDPGAAFALQLANTSGFQNFQVSFSLQSLDPSSARITTWALQYGIGASPTSFTTITTQPIGGTATGISSNTVTASFLTALDNISGPVWIRIVALSGSSGSNNRATTGLDDFTLTYSPSSADLKPTVASTVPANAATFVAANTNISFTFSEPVTAPSSAFAITGSSSGAHTFVLTGGPTSYTLNPDVDFTDGEIVTVTALAAQIADQDGTIDNMASDYSFSFTIAPTIVTVKIHDIQGTGLVFNPAYNSTLAIEGIVTRKFTGSTKLNGFYVQEEDADADADPLTSEAIFVFDPTGLFTGNEGDRVRVTGTPIEYTSGTSSSLTELQNLTSVVNMGASAMPAAVNVVLPVANVRDLERYEGMLVNLSASTGNLTVSEYFQLGRYGQVVLAANGPSNLAGTDARLDQYTQFNAPSVSGYSAYLAEIAKRKIYLDDGSTVQNPDPIIFGRGGSPLSASNTLRGGDEVSTVLGILDERLEGYRIQTLTGVNFTATNVRPVLPPSVGTATLKVASANVLNYFVNLDLSSGNGPYRGANTAQELTRQRTKIIKNLIGSGADVFGIMELQNNGTTPTTAVQDLVNGLNAEPGSSGTYAFIDPAGTGTSISTDAITVGIIYKTDKVTPLGNPATLTTSAAFALVGRRPLAQTFTQISNNQVFTLVVNHFKSKSSSSGGAGDADINDGQGSSNGTRTRQAQDLAAWLATNPTGTTDPDYLVVGDLNAYAKEDPLTTLEAAGYINQLPVTSYSYAFDAQFGSLDHALATSSLAAQVTGAEKWHINADEPSVLDYNVEFKTAGQITSLYSPDQFRSSDHDPVLVGLNLISSPDLTAIMYTSPAIQYGTTNCSVVVDVFEVNSVATTGPLTVYVSKDPLVELTFSSTATSVNNRPVTNSVWNFDGITNPSFYILTTTQPIAAGDVLSFGLNGVLTPGLTKGSLSLTSIVVGGSGGEVKITNNSDADKIDYFDK